VSWRAFDDLADRYDLWYRRNPATYWNEVRAVKALGLAGVGVEIGVGTGRFAAPLGIPLGIDMSTRMLRAAASRGINVVRASAESLPIRNSLLDYALFVVTLCFLEDPIAALEEARASLRPGGHVAACIVPRDSPWGVHYASSSSPFYSAAKFYSVDELLSMMRRAGLEPDAISSTLRYGPLDPPSAEEPVDGPGGGFVCVRSESTAP